MKKTSVDAFGYFPLKVSAISGLNDDGAASTDPEYAFHTPYVVVNTGLCRFDLDIFGISAGEGMLDVVLYREGFGKTPFSAVSQQRLSVADLIEAGGRMSFAFEGERRAGYALFGRLEEGTTIQARGIKIALEQPDDRGQRRPQPRLNANLMALVAPIFADPVCQPATRAQCDEPAYRDACRALSQSDQPEPDNWGRAYILHALGLYGHLGIQRAGIALFDDDAQLRQAVKATGTELFFARFAGDAFENTSPEEIIVESDMDIPGRPMFDFAWSRGHVDGLRNSSQAIAFVEQSRLWVRPGGLLLHVLACSSNNASREQFRLSDVERAVLNLHSLGLTVGQIRIGGIDRWLALNRDPAVTIPFGLIAQLQE